MKKFLIILIITKLNILLGQEDDPMNYIIDNLYLGDRIAAANETFLKEYNISIVINCAIQIISNYNDLKALELKLYDDPNAKLFPILEYVYKIIKQYQKTNILVHCMMGSSRSASVVIFYLMKEKKWDYDTCLKYVQERRPCADPSFHFVRQLKEYYNKYIK